MSPLRQLGFAALFLATAAAAQQRPIFDPDDFVDPRQHSGPVFVSRLLLGGALKPSDDYRPLERNTGFVYVTNSVFWRRVQFDYKHSEERGTQGPAPLTACGCTPPLFFPTPPPPGATPLAPPPGSKDFLQFAWYGPVPGRDAGPHVMLRYRATLMLHRFATDVQSRTGETISRLSGREQSFGLEADTYLRVGRRDVYGSLAFARTSQSGTTHDRKQSELTYTSRFPAVPVQKFLVRSTLTIGGVSDRGARFVNVVNPAVEVFLHDSLTRANFHLIWSPQRTRSALGGWQTRQQIAFYVDRKLWVVLFKPS